MLCYCKKQVDFKGKVIFFKDKYYYYETLSEKSVWVVYNKNGERWSTGYTFYLTGEYNYFRMFDDFFEKVGRKYKLNKLNKI